MVTSRSWYSSVRDYSGVRVKRFRFRFYALGAADEMMCDEMLDEDLTDHLESWESARLNGLTLMQSHEVEFFIPVECWREGSYIVRAQRNERCRFIYYKGCWFKSDYIRESLDYPEMSKKEWELLKAAVKLNWVKPHYLKVYKYWVHQYEVIKIGRESRLSMRLFLKRLEGLL